MAHGLPERGEIVEQRVALLAPLGERALTLLLLALRLARGGVERRLEPTGQVFAPSRHASLPAADTRRNRPIRNKSRALSGTAGRAVDLSVPAVLSEGRSGAGSRWVRGQPTRS
jgi:hypothetical protein